MKFITFVCVSCILAVFAYGASIADESLNIKEANQFLSRSKRDLWEECAREDCNAEEVSESMEGAGRSKSEEIREYINVINGKYNKECAREDCNAEEVSESMEG